MFKDEVERARDLNVKLTFGIGIFQGLSNLFINGIVLGVIYAGNNNFSHKFIGLVLVRLF